jgi:hypothetical protein
VEEDGEWEGEFSFGAHDEEGCEVWCNEADIARLKDIGRAPPTSVRITVADASSVANRSHLSETVKSKLAAEINRKNEIS